MNKEDTKKSDAALEGEGSYSATRRYNEHLADALDSTDVAAAADAARRALEGPEGDELKRAAELGKAGPKAKVSPVPAASKK